MNYRTIEQPRGRGRLVADGFSANVSYALTVSEAVIDAGHMQDPSATIRGGQIIKGRIEFEDPIQGLKAFANTFILHLEDGRRLQVFLNTADTITATGGFLPHG